MADYTSFTDQGLPPMLQALQAGQMMPYNNRARQLSLQEMLLRNKATELSNQRFEDESNTLGTENVVRNNLARSAAGNPEYAPMLTQGKIAESQMLRDKARRDAAMLEQNMDSDQLESRSKSWKS